MQERSKSKNGTRAGASGPLIRGPRYGSSALSDGGLSELKTSPRLALRISRRWDQVAPILRLSLPDGSALETFREEFSALLIGLLRGGVDMRRIERMPLASVMLLGRNDRSLWLSGVLAEQQAKQKVKVRNNPDATTRQ